MRNRRRLGRAAWCLWAGLLGASAGGCGSSPTVPVEGQVVWADGTPAGDLEGYQVESEVPGSKMGARGTIGPDGRFKLGTFTMDDGAEPGDHKAVISAPPRTEIDPPLKGKLPGRYAKPETSGLTFTVEGGRKNDVSLAVDRK